MTLRLSVLDQVPVRAGRSARDSVLETVELAQLVDSLGYRRYWLAEHHNSKALGCASPEVLLPMLAATTSRLRVGTGGIMLPQYAPLKVAENFRMLEALFPGRIDLGVGRAPGTDAVTAAALAYGSPIPVELYPAQVQELMGFLNDRSSAASEPPRVRAVPIVDTLPELWILGSSTDSAVLAALLGLPYCHAHFIQPETTTAALDLYRYRFRAGTSSSAATEPMAMLACSVVCADDDEAAQREVLSRAVWWLELTKGRPAPFPSPETAQDYPMSDNDRAVLRAVANRSFAGDRDTVATELKALADTHQVDELMVLTITHSAEVRRHSYELLASALIPDSKEP